MATADIHTLTGAYVLDAVTDLERVAFEGHMLECPACTDEVHELRATAARLGSAAAETPPAGMFERILAEIAQTRQLPPKTGEILVGRRRPPRRWARRVVVGIGSIAAAAAVLIGGITIGHQDPAPVAAGAPTSAPDLVTVTASGVHGGSATASVSRSQERITVDVHDLPALDSAHAYQIWLTSPRGPQSAGLLGAGDRSGHVAAAIPADVDRVSVTAEPATGSPQPTTAGVVAVALS